MEAVVFIGHGSRAPQGNVEFIHFITDVLTDVDLPIKEFCFWEREEPTLEMAVKSCVEQGATEITVIPVILLPGMQTNVEIPAEIARLALVYPNVSLQMKQPIGSDPFIARLLKERLEEKGLKGVNSEAILFIGHGSHDPAAASEFAGLASWFSEWNSCKVECAFLTTPPLVADKAAELGKEANKVFIVPYLLYLGGFRKMLEELVAADESYILCDEVGFDPLLKTILLERVQSSQLVK